MTNPSQHPLIQLCNLLEQGNKAAEIEKVLCDCADQPYENLTGHAQNLSRDYHGARGVDTRLDSICENAIKKLEKLSADGIDTNSLDHRLATVISDNENIFIIKVAEKLLSLVSVYHTKQHQALELSFHNLKNAVSEVDCRKLVALLGEMREANVYVPSAELRTLCANPNRDVAAAALKYLENLLVNNQQQAKIMAEIKAKEIAAMTLLTEWLNNPNPSEDEAQIGEKINSITGNALPTEQFQHGKRFSAYKEMLVERFKELLKNADLVDLVRWYKNCNGWKHQIKDVFLDSLKQILAQRFSSFAIKDVKALKSALSELVKFGIFVLEEKDFASLANNKELAADIANYIRIKKLFGIISGIDKSNHVLVAHPNSEYSLKHRRELLAELMNMQISPDELQLIFNLPSFQNLLNPVATQACIEKSLSHHINQFIAADRVKFRAFLQREVVPSCVAIAAKIEQDENPGRGLDKLPKALQAKLEAIVCARLAKRSDFSAFVEERLAAFDDLLEIFFEKTAQDQYKLKSEFVEQGLSEKNAWSVINEFLGLVETARINSTPIFNTNERKLLNGLLMAIKAYEAELANEPAETRLAVDHVKLFKAMWRSEGVKTSFERALTSNLFFTLRLKPALKAPIHDIDFTGLETFESIICARSAIIAALQKDPNNASLASMVFQHFGLSDDAENQAPLVCLGDNVNYLAVATATYNLKNPGANIEISGEQYRKLQEQDQLLAELKLRHLPVTGFNSAMVEEIRRLVTKKLLDEELDKNKIAAVLTGHEMATELSDIPLQILICRLPLCEIYEGFNTESYQLELRILSRLFLDCDCFSETDLARELRDLRPRVEEATHQILLNLQACEIRNQFVSLLKKYYEQFDFNLNLVVDIDLALNRLMSCGVLFTELVAQPKTDEEVKKLKQLYLSLNYYHETNTREKHLIAAIKNRILSVCPSAREELKQQAEHQKKQIEIMGSFARLVELINSKNFNAGASEALAAELVAKLASPEFLLDALFSGKNKATADKLKSWYLSFDRLTFTNPQAYPNIKAVQDVLLNHLASTLKGDETANLIVAQEKQRENLQATKEMGELIQALEAYLRTDMGIDTSVSSFEGYLSQYVIGRPLHIHKNVEPAFALLASAKAYLATGNNPPKLTGVLAGLDKKIFGGVGKLHGRLVQLAPVSAVQKLEAFFAAALGIKTARQLNTFEFIVNDDMRKQSLSCLQYCSTADLIAYYRRILALQKLEGLDEKTFNVVNEIASILEARLKQKLELLKAKSPLSSEDKKNLDALFLMLAKQGKLSIAEREVKKLYSVLGSSFGFSAQAVLSISELSLQPTNDYFIQSFRRALVSYWQTKGLPNSTIIENLYGADLGFAKRQDAIARLCAAIRHCEVHPGEESRQIVQACFEACVDKDPAFAKTTDVITLLTAVNPSRVYKKQANVIAEQLRGASTTVISAELRAKFAKVASLYATLTKDDAKDSERFARIYDEKFENEDELKLMLAEAAKLFTQQKTAKEFLEAYAQVTATLLEAFLAGGWSLTAEQALTCVNQLVAACALNHPVYAAVFSMGQEELFSLAQRVRQVDSEVAQYLKTGMPAISSYCAADLVSAVERSLQLSSSSSSQSGTRSALPRAEEARRNSLSASALAEAGLMAGKRFASAPDDLRVDSSQVASQAGRDPVPATGLVGGAQPAKTLVFSN